MRDARVIVWGPPAAPLRIDERMCTDPYAMRAAVVVHRLARKTKLHPFWHCPACGQSMPEGEA